MAEPLSHQQLNTIFTVSSVECSFGAIQKDQKAESMCSLTEGKGAGWWEKKEKERSVFV